MKKGKFYQNLVAAVLLLSLAGLTACSDDDDDVPPPPKVTTGFFALSEGSWGDDNAQMGYYDMTTGIFTKDYFKNKNSRALGDLAQDIKQYGAKIYCTVSGSSILEIMDITGKSVKTIPFQETGKTQPRCLAFSGSKAYLTLQDGYVARIDTATYTVDYVKVGDSPEGICLANNKLYITNTGYHPTYTNTVSVVNITTFTETKKITVGLNPYWIAADNAGNVYLSIRGNYDTEFESFQRIDAQTDAVTTLSDIVATRFIIENNLLYGYYTNWFDSGSASTVFIYNLTTQSVQKAQFITDGTVISSAYGIAVNPLNGDVLVGDALDYTVNGNLYCFDKTGKKKYSFETGMGPNNMLFMIN